jgi:hypothetical protein
MPQLLAETLEHGLFISVPKLKAHRYSVVSMGIKGMQGTVMRCEGAPAYNQTWRMQEELKEYLGERKRREPEDRGKYVRSLELFAERMVDVLKSRGPTQALRRRLRRAVPFTRPATTTALLRGRAGPARPFSRSGDRPREQLVTCRMVEWSRVEDDSRCARTAVIEARLSAPEVVTVLRAGARLPLALYRMEGKEPRRYLAWRPPLTAKPNFHVPDGFGVLVVDF